MKLFPHRIQIIVAVALVLCTSSQDCNTPILRDIINVDSVKKAEFINGLGTPTVGVLPLLNQSVALELRHLGNFQVFSSPVFTLDTAYWITAIDIQFGSVGSCAGENRVLSMETVRIGGDGTTPANNPFIEIGYADNNVMNLTELGDPNSGRIIRLKINPTDGRYIKYRVSRENC